MSSAQPTCQFWAAGFSMRSMVRKGDTHLHPPAPVSVCILQAMGCEDTLGPAAARATGAIGLSGGSSDARVSLPGGSGQGARWS